MKAACLLIVASLAGCGRLSFDPLTTGGGDGGASDGDGALVTGDAAPPAVDCHIAHPSAIYCNSMEGVLADTFSYNVIMNGRAEATPTRAFRGTQALEIESFDINDYKSARWGVFFPAAVNTGDLYLRAYYWMSSATTITDQASIFSTFNSVDPFPGVNTTLVPGQVMLSTFAMNFGGFAFEFPRDRWVCYEVHIAVDDVAGNVEVSVDGAAPFQTGAVDTLYGTGYTAVDVGLHYATPGQSPLRMWADEVIVDTVPIGCE